MDWRHTFPLTNWLLRFLVSRKLWLTVGFAAALWLIIAGPFWVIAFYRQYHAQRVLDELQPMVPGTTSFAEVSGRLTTLGYHPRSDQPCTATDCVLWVEDYSYPFVFIRHYAVGKWAHRISQVPWWRFYNEIEFRDGHLRKSWVSAIRLHPYWANGVTSEVSETLSPRSHWDPVGPVPGTFEVWELNTKGASLQVRTSNAATAEQRAATFDIKLACLNHPRECAPCQMAPGAWRARVLYKKSQPGVTETDPCPPPNYSLNAGSD